MKLTLKLATEADISLLAKMNKQLIDDEGNSNPMNVEQLEVRMKVFLATDYLADIILLEDAIVGYALYRFSDNDTNSHCKDVYIRQYFIVDRFRCKGYGIRGVELLKEQRFASIDILSVDVLAANHSGHQFWLKAGLQPYVINMKVKL
ncbi:GNAT family N-acetyltransferase [Paenibacillus sp. GSMTC-2017]|uniref:GNAT family N-acetyltransferase n=1 Tax=Paenibacillus sp. GSMTC-2017 TaxID=2794350 RepID=UPI0018D6C220|nr:GNAT family N-acetyltransferase [Paenibacillus sp. GSMTC-2017]MBH5316832.1 GNAT family N-acetyltransferase [Paenibacillus sp. GSMTC-2017]